MDAKAKPTKHREVQVSCEAGCRERRWTYLRRLQKLMTSLRYGIFSKKCKDILLYLTGAAKGYQVILC